MPPRRDLYCPYCGGHTFDEAVQIEPFDPAAPRGEWENRCRTCGKWSRCVVQPDGTCLQIEKE